MIPPGIKRQSKLQQQIFNTLYLLRIVISNTRLYSSDHPKTRQMITEAHNSLHKTLTNIKELSILVIDNDLIINNKAIRAEEADYFALFITILKEKDIGRIVFRKGVTRKELASFLFDLSSSGAKNVYNSPTITSGKLALTEAPGSNLSSPDSPFAINNQGKPGDEVLSLTAKLKTLSSKQLHLAQELYFSIKKEQDFDLRGI